MPWLKLTMAVPEKHIITVFGLMLALFSLICSPECNLCKFLLQNFEDKMKDFLICTLKKLCKSHG